MATNLGLELITWLWVPLLLCPLPPCKLQGPPCAQKYPPGTWTIVRARPGSVDGNVTDSKAANRAGLGMGNRQGRGSLVTGVTHNHSARSTTQEQIYQVMTHVI